MFDDVPTIKRGIAQDRLICRACPDTIRVGEAINVFIYDHNPVGTGPAEHAYHGGIPARMSPFERRRRAGLLPVADITGHRAPTL
jgi:hypothetical protein